jgi:glycosyltransferase involved in cell wall biosynthesis
VTVLLATHDDARFLREAIESVLQQTERDVELLVVDDASSDDTPGLLASVDDRRLRTLRNDEQRGLAASLNRGLDESDSRYVARLDADDVAHPERVEHQVARARATRVAVVGTAVYDLDADGTRGKLHRMPESERAVRWHALFSSPFFHPTVLVDRDALGSLRYDPDFLESEDYDLWARLLATGAEGANLGLPLVSKRVHAGQASLRRRELQESFQRRVAFREIERLAPDVDAERAWSGDGREFVRLLRAFEQRYGKSPEVRRAAKRRLLRAGRIWSAWRA